jgi:hypothetical protein
MRDYNTVLRSLSPGEKYSIVIEQVSEWKQSAQCDCAVTKKLRFTTSFVGNMILAGFVSMFYSQSRRRDFQSDTDVPSVFARFAGSQRAERSPRPQGQSDVKPCISDMPRTILGPDVRFSHCGTAVFRILHSTSSDRKLSRLPPVDDHEAILVCFFLSKSCDGRSSRPLSSCLDDEMLR